MLIKWQEHTNKVSIRSDNVNSNVFSNLNGKLDKHTAILFLSDLQGDTRSYFRACSKLFWVTLEPAPTYSQVIKLTLSWPELLLREHVGSFAQKSINTFSFLQLFRIDCLKWLCYFFTTSLLSLNKMTRAPITCSLYHRSSFINYFAWSGKPAFHLNVFQPDWWYN